MRSAEESRLKTDYSNRWYETFFMDARADSQEHNLNLFREFLNEKLSHVKTIDYESSSKKNPMFYWFKDVPFEIAFSLIQRFTISKAIIGFILSPAS